MSSSGDVCDCLCHTEGGIHMMACCFPCPECGQNIKFGCLKKHAQECNPTKEEEESSDE
jgi:hypothetical protein